MPPNDEIVGNADRRSQWFGRALGQRAGKGERRPNPATIPIAGQSATGPAWAPAGPAAVLNGQAVGAPAVSGRVLDLAVGPGSRRAYAATADGGVWRYTEDHSVSPPALEWIPLHDGVRSLDATTTSANALATGAVVVRWGDTPADDRLFIGTGEVHPGPPSGLNNPGDATWVAGGFGGIGVRVSSGEPGPDGVLQEAVNLDGHGFNRLVRDTNSDEVVWAATDVGIYRRPSSGMRTNWTHVTDASFPANDWYVTDIAITGSGADTVVWAAFWHRGVWRLSGGAWAQVPGIPAFTANAPGNIVLAASDANADAVYALTGANQLFRYDGARFQRIVNSPPLVTSGQGWYDLAIAVQPGSADQVVLAGDLTWSPATATAVANFDAMVLSAAVTASGSTWDFGFTLPATATRDQHNQDPSFIGGGVHPDVHRVVFGRQTAGDGDPDDAPADPNDVWICCDGGVFRSTNGLVNGSFRAVNVGLSSIQFNHLASHPSFESIVLAGSQDNGVMRRLGSSTWYEAPQGDGGGVAIDPVNPRRMAAQSTESDLSATTVGGIGGGEWRDIDVPTSTLRTGGRLREAVQFYAPLRTSPAGSNPMMLVYPTHRVWASANWGNRWVTIPSGRRPTNAQVNHDSPTGNARTALTDVVVANATTIYACTETTVYRYDRTHAPTGARPAGRWAAAVTVPAAGPPAGLPAGRSIQAMAVESAAPESLYVALGGSGVDHVYWFDQANNVWQPTGLGGAGISFDAPVSCLALDPNSPDDIYAGSPLGVWKGVRRTVGANRVWTWTNVSTRLPEATVLDLSVQTYGTGAGALGILRAATHGRGLWELVLGPVETPDPDVHLRMNTAEAGRRHASAAAVDDPERMPGTTTTWLSSPDIRLRRPSLPVSPTLVPPSPGVVAPPPFDSILRRGHRDRRAWNGPNREPVHFLQRNILRRGVPVGVDGDFGGGTQTAVQTLQRRWATMRRANGRVDSRTWLAITSVPDLGVAPIDPVQFAQDIRPDYDETSGAMIADATGDNRLFVQLHARGTLTQAADDVRVALLLAPLNGTPLTAGQLPAGWAAHIVAGDTSWTGATPWVLAGGTSPYRSPPGDLGDRGPEIVEWTLDFAALGFAAGDELIALVAVHAPGQELNVTTRNARTAVESSPAVAARHVRLDAVSAIPPP